MLSSKKTVTSRTRKYGDRGDQFEAFGAPFVLLGVTRLPLFEVADKWHKAEGFEDREGFIEIWNKIHPKITFDFDPDRKVFLHRFIRRNLLLATSSWPGHVLPEDEAIQW